MRLSLLAILAALLLDGCGVDTSQPATVPEDGRWGHLAADSSTAASSTHSRSSAAPAN